MIRISFTIEDKKQLHFERYNHPHPRVQQKMEVLYLKSLDKLSHQMICEISGVSPNTIRGYFKEYQQGGIEKLKEINFYKPQSKLVEFKGKIEDYLKSNPPATIAEAAFKIEELTGIKRGLTQISKFIKSLGVKLRKVGAIPANAISEKKTRTRRIP
jgi:transposase